MMELLRSWVKDIFIIVVGLYFIEIVLPDGNMRKYIKFIFSIMILGVVISPLIHLGSFGELMETNALATQGKSQESPYEVAELEEVQWVQMEQVYQTKIQTQVKGILEESLPEVEIQGMEVLLAEHVDEKEFGKVNKIVIKTDKSEYVNSIKQYVSLGLGIEQEKIIVEVQTEDGNETQKEKAAKQAGKDEKK